MRTLHLSLAVACLILLTGCAKTGRAEITFQKQSAVGAPMASSARNSLFENFPGAYITSNRDGEYDLLLVNDTLRASAAPAHKKPLRPVAEPPLQQVVYIHIFWRPTHGAMVRESSITNAIVHWYVFSADSSRGTDMLHYQGAAFVKLSGKGAIAQVTIGDGEISPKDVRGSLKDPVGVSHITGNITAVRNDSRVRELLLSLQDKVAGNDRYWTEARSEQEPSFGR